MSDQPIAVPVPRKSRRKSVLVPRQHDVEDILFYWGLAEPIVVKKEITRKMMTGSQLRMDPPKNKTKRRPFQPFGSTKPPSATHWSVFQVFAYFRKFFPDTAHVMLTARIDGVALMLLQRADVLQMRHNGDDDGSAGVPGARRPAAAGAGVAPLDLGTALRMYAHVVRLQTRSNDMRLSWNV